jgi:putative flippase GtrA
MKKLVVQIIRFGGVGAFCTALDFVLLTLCTELLSLNVLFSAAVAFTVSMVVNYFLSVFFVFSVDKSKSKTRNFAFFVVFSLIGLALTEVIMHIGVNILFWNYMAVKILATVVVMVFNFITRKKFLE